MKRCIWIPVVALFLVFAAGASPAFARGRIPILIVWGQGEKIASCGELPASVRDAVSKELDATVEVGFLYSSFTVFFADLWTWSGRHVLYSGELYWEPDADAWRRMLGESPKDSYGEPFLFSGRRFPGYMEEGFRRERQSPISSRWSTSWWRHAKFTRSAHCKRPHI